MIRIDSALDEQNWWGEARQEDLPDIEEESGPIIVGHVVDAYNHYPGETATFYTRLDVREVVEEVTLRVSIPPEMNLGEYVAATDQPDLMPTLETDSAGWVYLVWSLAGRIPAGTRYEFQAEAQIALTQHNLSLTSQAVVATAAEGNVADEKVTVMVRPKGEYIKYLPSLYERDDLMGRFLMLFESFLKPISQQIDAMHYYFDPRITPADFLPWLATWLDFPLDERWPVTSQRQLIRWAIALHRSRGTKWGLLKYLEIYTGQTAEIVERRAKNFVLGGEARMGPGIALGQGNRPHTFTVNLHLPPIDADSKQERERLTALRQRTIEAIIEMQKPAHTVYMLNIEPLSAKRSDKETAEKRETANEKSKKDDEIAAQAAIWFKLDD